MKVNTYPGRALQRYTWSGRLHVSGSVIVVGTSDPPVDARIYPSVSPESMFSVLASYRERGRNYWVKPKDREG